MTNTQVGARPELADQPSFLVHGRTRLALHQLRREGPLHPLLLLHALGDHAPASVPHEAAGWDGPIYALDFSGHGRSGVSDAGGYTCEVLMADADHALAEIGPATVLGWGLGGYIAVLIAGARAPIVRGAIVADGVGLTGGATTHTSVRLEFTSTDTPTGSTPDPYALLELSCDVRPTDYASLFAQAATAGAAELPGIIVAAKARPPWLVGVLDQFGVEIAELRDALDTFASRSGRA